MSTGNDWIWRPVRAGMCTAGEIKSGLVDLCDIAEMNEALDVYADNRARYEEWRKDHPNG